MGTTLTLVAAVALLAWFWADSLRARERANRICARACDQRGVQLLDQTVALHRLWLRWGRDGIRLARSYLFEYSEEGTGRRVGRLVLAGREPEVIWFDLP